MPTLKLTRNQFASFLKDAEQIKQFERLFNIAGSSVTVDEATVDDGDYLIWDETAQSWVAKQPDPLTRVDDTNVTLTLGGIPGTALFNPVSITAGWTGTLAVDRGGTGGGVPSGTLLDNITGFTLTGTMVRTGAGTYAFRTNTGTADRITITNGDGVAGNPTYDISASYVGQTSITTLGTITAGVWNGTAITAGFGGTGLSSYTSGDLIYATGATTLTKLAIGASNTVLRSNGTEPVWGQVVLTTDVTGILPGANGGTGVANTGKTITLGGNLTTSGAFDLTLTLTGATNVTLPTTGTLATLAGSETLTNKSITSPVMNATPSTSWGIDFAPSTSANSYVTIANNGVYTLAVGSGMIFIFSDSGANATQMAVFFGGVNIVWQDAANLFTNTHGTAGKINVSFNGTTAYRIQNLTGASVNLYVNTMRMRAAT